MYDPIMNFLVAYDIADPKRLRRVAQRMEHYARRVQKSVFVFTGTRRQLDDALCQVVHEMDIGVDRIQAWPIRTSNHVHRSDAGAALPDAGVAAIVSPEVLLIVEAIDGPPGDDAPLLDT